MGETRDWQPIETAPLGVEVMTKIDDAGGVRNETRLIGRQRIRESRVMWWLPSGDVYVYYTPTHWSPTPATASL